MEQDSGSKPEREYDKTGLYPPNGKAFRVWALLAWLVGVITAIALVSVLINQIVIG